MQDQPAQADRNPYASVDPALAAAYNAAFATLQDRGAPHFPDLSQLPPGSVPIALGGQMGVAQPPGALPAAQVASCMCT